MTPVSEDTKAISVKYRKIRREREISQCDLAVTVGVSPAAISKFEKNARLVSMELRQRIINALEQSA